MAYGPQENETEEESEARFVRERARREIRKQQRAAKKQEKNQLKQARGSKARRRIKEQFMMLIPIHTHLQNHIQIQESETY